MSCVSSRNLKTVWSAQTHSMLRTSRPLGSGCLRPCVFCTRDVERRKHKLLLTILRSHLGKETCCSKSHVLAFVCSLMWVCRGFAYAPVFCTNRAQAPLCGLPCAKLTSIKKPKNYRFKTKKFLHMRSERKNHLVRKCPAVKIVVLS